MLGTLETLQVGIKIHNDIITQLYFLIIKGFTKSISRLCRHAVCTMERLGRLSALLASFSVLHWLVLFTGPQGITPAAAPQLSLSPSHHIFVQGEQVTLNCTVPKGKKANSFSFYEWKKNRRVILAEEQIENTLEVPITHLDSKKTFACSYVYTWSLLELKSELSKKIAFPVTERPLAPTLSLQPWHPIYIQGERVTLICSAPAWADVTGYTFWEEGGDQIRQPHPKTPNNTFALDGTSSQLFYCMYWIWVSRREIKSSLSNSVNVARTARPGAPTLSLQPQHPVYIQGEDVTLNCSAPTVPSPAEYTFYEERGGRVFVVQPKGHRNTFGLDGNTAGQFHCLYQFWKSKRAIQSPRSISVFVNRTESPQPPTVSLHPQHPVYIQGEEITLICSAPRKENVTGYNFYQEIGGQVLEVLSGNHHATLRVGEETAGKYHCVYWIRVTERKIQSQWSNSVYVSRTEPLRPPELKVDPPSGAVNEGEPLLISCLTNRRNTEKRFHFYKDGVEMDSSNEGSLRSISGDPSPNATLRILQANSSYSGEFACSFEENVSSRRVFSPWSQKVNVTASKVEKQFPPQRNEEATGCLERLEPQPAQTEARQRRQIAVEEEGASYSEIQFPPTQRTNSVEEEGVSYSEIQFCLNSLKAMEEDSALYSNLQFQASHGLKPVEKDQVLYSTIQFQPTHGVAK
ncbi:hypothetical protein lerEdw1_003181 [Lerista edwardsae]|nr:hypothetical protein lerEdw1_003181 [Lerista edwardsae]